MAKETVQPTGTPASSWLDETSNKPLIDRLTQRMQSFLDAVADGKIDDAELADQESRLVALMREIEPQLDPPMHAKVTQLLCELTAYDLMQVMNSLGKTRPQTQFRG